ncbi:conserved Plasmodium protein, unknown function [Plasmodium sp. DRC-Itaito]|uniref:SAP domain-containing protein n=1 Tax=Plasmodium gaboni TaxID=647221 RepID=A0ABY1ULS6_9APIC|nr:conserved Plasmodium protein, unknown function [Plasmodium gaboni]SOV22492.1 conserved Plasmodium protein, unknown function [Plasmodium sp. DRC-Itaito]
MSNYQNLKCSELKDLLAKRGLPSHGKKNELLERLLKHEEKDNINSLSSSYILDNSNINNDDNKNNNCSFQNNASDNSLKLQTSSNSIFEKNTVDSFGNVDDNNKKKVCTVNNKEESNNKIGLNKMKNYIRNILTINSNSTNPAYDNNKDNNDDKNNSNKDTQNQKNKTVIQEITFNDVSSSSQNTLQRNIISTDDNDSYLSEEKKRELRRKRFGVVNTDDALESRAKRFSIVTHKMEEENKRKRAERFGLNVAKMNDFEKKKKRAERFGLLQDSEKLKARALRFGITQ